jgi:hypothetical protein
MRGLLCVAFSLGWPVLMWFFVTSIVSFVRWDNYFLIGFGQWHDLSRFMFLLFWVAGIVVFIECSSNNELESK